MRSVILLLLVILLIHLPALRGGFVWDDKDTVIRERCPGLSWWRLFIPAEFSRCAGELGYRPLVAISHELDTALWGKNPAGHHMTNIVLHLLVALLLAILIRDIGYSRGAMIMGTLIVSVHPLTVEPVSAISFRTDIMATAFMLGSLLLARRARYVPAILVFLGALLCKETALLLPVGVIMMINNRRARLSGVMALLSAGYLFIRFGMARSAAESVLPYMGGSFRAAVVNAPAMLFRAAGHLLYPRPCPDRSALEPASAVMTGMSWIGLAAILLALILLYRKQHHHVIWLGMVLLFLLPSLGLYPLKMILADRYLYTPLMFAGVSVAWVISRYNGRLRYGIAGLIICGEMWVALITQPMWWNEETLFRETAVCAPKSASARYNYGRSLAQLGRYAEAEEELNHALSLRPSYTHARLALGVVQFRQGRFTEAVQSFRRAELSGGEDPRIAVNIAQAFLGLTDTVSAVTELNRALTLDGQHPAALTLLDTLRGYEKEFP